MSDWTLVKVSPQSKTVITKHKIKAGQMVLIDMAKWSGKDVKTIASQIQESQSLPLSWFQDHHLEVGSMTSVETVVQKYSLRIPLFFSLHSSPDLHLFPLIPLIQHSCRPNCLMQPYGATGMALYAFRDLREGEEVTTCKYGDDLELLPRVDRGYLLPSCLCATCGVEKKQDKENSMWLSSSLPASSLPALLALEKKRKSAWEKKDSLEAWKHSYAMSTTQSLPFPLFHILVRQWILTLDEWGADRMAKAVGMKEGSNQFRTWFDNVVQTALKTLPSAFLATKFHVQLQSALFLMWMTKEEDVYNHYDVYERYQWVQRYFKSCRPSFVLGCLQSGGASSLFYRVVLREFVMRTLVDLQLMVEEDEDKNEKKKKGDKGDKEKKEERIETNPSPAATTSTTTIVPSASSLAAKKT